MTEEQAVQPDSAPPETTETNVPNDFKGYVKFRKTGELPAATEIEQPAAAEETQAKTEPQSGAEETQQPEEEDKLEEELTASQKRRRRRVDRLAAENEQLKQQLASIQQPKMPPAKAEPPPGKPRLEAYETLEEYQEALTDWHITQREATRQADADAKAATAAAEKLQTEWDSRQQAARKAHPDYDDVIDSVTAPEGPGVAAARQAMLEDDAGAEILYYLATHKAELARIAALPPIAAVREIGRLSATVSPSSGAANGKQRFTAAPPPPPPSTRPARTVSDSIFDPAVQADFKRWTKARAAMKEK